MDFLFSGEDRHLGEAGAFGQGEGLDSLEVGIVRIEEGLLDFGSGKAVVDDDFDVVVLDLNGRLRRAFRCEDAGGVNVYAGLHLWTADAQTPQERADWATKLAAMAALQPTRVIPGHSAVGAKQDASQIAWSQAYLVRYEQELPKAANSAALIGAMKQAYPDAGLGVALDIGAKVNKGEMKW